MYVVYIDVLFVINLVMDTIIFFVVATLMNWRINLKKIFIGGILTALLYCMLILIPVLQDIPQGISSLIIPIIPILYTFNPKTKRQFVKVYGLCMTVACLIGGVSFSLWYQIGYSQYISTASIGYLFIISISVGSIVYFSFYEIRRRFIMPNFEYKVEVEKDNKVVSALALLDTGNCLYTTISHRPVIIMDYELIKPLLTEEQIRCLELSDKHIDQIYDKSEGFQYLIPFCSIGCKASFLWGIEVDKIYIKKACFQKSLSRCIVGVSKERLFNNEDYEVLLHPEMIMSEEA